MSCVPSPSDKAGGRFVRIIATIFVLDGTE
jgi:hypothetical protein